MSTSKVTSSQVIEPSLNAREPQPEELLTPLARLLGRQAARKSWAAQLTRAPADPLQATKEERIPDDTDIKASRPPPHGERGG